MRKLLFILGVMFLLAGCSTLKTPEIKGVVVDAETGKPIADARIYATWKRTYSGPGGPSGGGISKELRLETDKQGRFTVPPHLLINLVPYPFGQGGSFFLIFYSHGYMYKRFNAHAEEQIYQKELNDVASGKDVVISLNRVKTPNEWDDNLMRIPERNNDYLREEKIWFVSSFGKIVWSNYVYQSRLSDVYEELGDYVSAYRKLEEIIANDQTAEKYFRKRITGLKNKSLNKGN